MHVNHELPRLLLDRAGVTRKALVSDEEQHRPQRAMRLRTVHHLHEEVGPLVRHQLRDRQQDRTFERRQVIRRGLARLDVREPVEVQHGRHDAHVVITELLELAGVVPGIGDRLHDSWTQQLELAAAEREQLGERPVVRLVIAGRRDVVVHEHEWLGTIAEKVVHLGLADRRVEHNQVTGVIGCVALERPDVVMQRRVEVPGEDLRRSYPAQNCARTRTRCW